MATDPHPNDIPHDENVSGGPIADKGESTRPMHGTDRPASGPDKTPGVDPDAVDAIVDDGGRHELDFEQGTMDDAAITAGDSVVEATYSDRGPATHLEERVDASAAADIADVSAGDRMLGTDLEADIDSDAPLPTLDDR